MNTEGDIVRPSQPPASLFLFFLSMRSGRPWLYCIKDLFHRVSLKLNWKMYSLRLKTARKTGDNSKFFSCYLNSYVTFVRNDDNINSLAKSRLIVMTIIIIISAALWNRSLYVDQLLRMNWLILSLWTFTASYTAYFSSLPQSRCSVCMSD